MNDELIVTAIRLGDREAYRLLMDRHHATIYRLCYRLSGNATDADTLAHDAFVEAYLKLDQLRNPERFGAWLRELALNLFRMAYRSRSRHPRESFEDLSEEFEDEALPNLLDTVTENLGIRCVEEGLTRLTSAHRLMLLLHGVEGLTYEEVATFLDVPIGTVMSRLHRARRSLRRIVDSLEEEDVMTTVNEIDFAQEVDAELQVLLRMFPEDRTAMERLSVVLVKSPERLAQLVRDSEDNETLQSLALLLRRLGPPALKVMLECRLAADKILRDHAQSVLARMLNLNRATVRAEGSRMATRDATMLLDLLIAVDATELQKVEIVIQLMQETKDEPTVQLLTNLLHCWPETAFSQLMARFQAFTSVREMYRSSDVLYALIRTGTRFGIELLEILHEEDEDRKAIATTALEGLVRAMNHEWWDIDDATEDRQLWEARFRRKWSPPLRRDRNPAVIQEIQAVILQWLRGTEASHREASLKMIGLLKTAEHREAVREWIQRGEATTRILAIRAASDLFDVAAIPNLLEAAMGEIQPVQLTALAALGRFLAVPAEPREWVIRENTAGNVCKAAISMLGESEGNVLSVLEELRRSPEPRVAEAAGNAWRGPFHAWRGPSHLQSVADIQKGQRTVRSWQMKDTVLEGAEPLAQISLDGALRNLPEIRVYEERELTKLIAQFCHDYSATRRYLIEEGLMTRERGRYEMTEWGKAVWRVERFVRDHYLKSA